MKIDWPTRGHSYIDDDLSGLSELLISEKGLTAGPQAHLFETEFSEKFKLNASYATMSCAHALDIVGKLVIENTDQEVILPAHTYCATALGFARAGAKLVWADIDPKHLTITLSEIERLTTDKTKVIVVVHLYGLICPEIEKIMNFAKQRNIVVVEDCAQCIGAKFNEKYAGTFGDFATFSFHAQKNLTTLGEGGMLAVKDAGLDKKIRALRLNGHLPFEDQEKYWLPAMTDVTDQSDNSWPMKATITDAQALVGRNVLKRLDQMTLKRKQNALAICSKLDKYSEIIFQENLSNVSHCNHLLPFKLVSDNIDRDTFMDRMFNEFGIKCVIQYYPLYRYDLFKYKGFAHTGLICTDDFYDNMISLPFSHELTEQELDYIVNSMTNIMDSSA